MLSNVPAAPQRTAPVGWDVKIRPLRNFRFGKLLFKANDAATNVHATLPVLPKQVQQPPVQSRDVLPVGC
jgi:hypothetical protein